MSSTLADHLRAASDDELGALLQLRPDLAVPVPADLGQLAGRVQSRVSVARALDRLDQFTLEVLDGLRYVRGEGGLAAVETLLTLTAEAGADSARVRSAVQRLRELHVIYDAETGGHVRVVGAVHELMGPNPAGLGRPAAQLVRQAGSEPPVDIVALATDPAGLRRALLSAPPDARAVLDRLAEGPPIGQVMLYAVPPESPIRWLLDHGLLVAIDEDLVELPREVGLVLRRDAGPLGTLHPTPPPIDGRPRPGADAAGAGQAMEAVRHLDALLAAAGENPPPVLRTRGLGVRELRRLAKTTGLDEATTALLLEIAEFADMLATGPAPGSQPASAAGYGAPAEVWLPTPAYDLWRAWSVGRQWALIARTWLSMTRATVLVGQRDDRDKVIAALSVDDIRASAPGIRRSALDVLAGEPESTAVDEDAVLARLAWRYPRRYGRHGGLERSGREAGLERSGREAGLERSGREAGHGSARPMTEMHARAALREAAALGVTGLEAVTSYGRVLLSERPQSEDDDPLGIRPEPDPVVAALGRLLPAPVDHVLVQADLTVISPGPPEPALAAELAAIADAESRGGATVYRVTPTSVRRALDAGYAPADLHALFRRRSRTSLPQTLTYLIDDVARRHGGLRVSTAGAYLRGDDETLLTEVLADRRLAGLALRRLAPTVLATAHAPDRLLDVLRNAGYAPVAEDASGAVVLTRSTAARAPVTKARLRSGELGSRTIGRSHVEDPERLRLTGPRLAGVVEQIRRGDRIARAARSSPVAKPPVGPDGSPVTPNQAHAQALAVLRQGITERRKVWVRFVDAQGGAGARLVRPVSMGGGFLHAEDDRGQTRHTFALHRITAAALDS